MTRAYSRGATLVVANLQYSGIVFAAIYSLLLFGDQIAPDGLGRHGVIIASGIVPPPCCAPAQLPKPPRRTLSATSWAHAMPT
jgi:S-adenosylmethionine uptake transporter